MFCSTVIPTIGRPTLSRAVESVLEQDFTAADYEVVVVNDSGRPLPEAAWKQSPRVQLLDTNRHERSVARNAGATVARGQYLHFLDDDDWLLPGALQSLWMLAQDSEAVWLYGGSRLVDRQGKPLVQLQHSLNGNGFLPALAGEWIPLQASLIEARAFFTAGGFNPLISGPEDIDLLRRIALRHDLAETPAIVAAISWRTTSSTTDYDRHPEQSRWARERILDTPSAFGRMRATARSGYWHGRLVRAYLTSVIWNLQRRRPIAAAGRASFGLLGLLHAGRHTLSPGFWRAVAQPYASETFRRRSQAATEILSEG
jgi:glycosyltransferase involved in cell wall biosynthesis